jgi:hypothetical protein
MINVTGVDLVKLVQEAYDLSEARGFGMLHWVHGPLSREEATELVKQFEGRKDLAISLDYVKGRACKMTVFKQGEELFINDSWYDHSDWALKELRRRLKC